MTENISGDLVAQSIPTDIQDELTRLNIGEFQVGDRVIKKDSGIYTITGFRWEPQRLNNGDLISVLLIDLSCLYMDGLMHHYGSIEPERFRGGRKEFFRLHGSYDEVMAEALDALTHPQPEESASTTTTLSVSASTDRMKNLMAQREKVAERSMVLKLMVERKLYEMEQRYKKIMREVHYMGRVITLLETFLGIYQEIELIRDGDPAPLETPVTVRQLILHMDEEVGSVDEQHDGQIGIDFKTVYKFDEWLLEDPAHVDGIAPELKCVVALRPSRQDREYQNDPLGEKRRQNNYIYLLIRNGDKLYRVWANMKMGGYDRLFPTSAEMEKLVDQMNAPDIDEEKELELKNKELDWRQNAVLIEGLFDRTEVFNPIPAGLSLFRRESYEQDQIRLVRDAEPALDDGKRRPRYDDWHQQLNSELKRGSRILLVYPERYTSYHERSGFFLNSDVDYEMPAPGVYVLESVERRNQYEAKVMDVVGYRTPFGDETKWPIYGETFHMETRFDEYLTFLYMPGDGTRWAGYHEGYVERTQRVRFFVHRSDWFILNYDEIDLDSVRYYISDRLERRNYQNILPTLYKIRAERLKEQVYEAPFVTLIANDLGCDEAQVWEAVFWWKYKTIGHRGLGEDEAKAWRMIRKRVLNPHYLEPHKETE